MCDYSLHNVKTRPAKVGDRLTTRLFSLGTTGFSASEDASVAVCVLPGTELSFAEEVRRIRSWPWTTDVINHKTAIFRQINQNNPTNHHDALEFPDGQIVLLTLLEEGQHATVLQLPASRQDDEDEGELLRELRECQVFDVSPVVEPQYQGTSVDARSRAMFPDGLPQSVELRGKSMSAPTVDVSDRELAHMRARIEIAKRS